MTLCASCRLSVLQADGGRPCRNCGHLLCFKCFGFRSIYHAKMDNIFHKPRAVCLYCHLDCVENRLLHQNKKLQELQKVLSSDDEFKDLDQARNKVLNISYKILEKQVLKDFATYVHQRRYLADTDKQDRIWQGLFEDTMKGFTSQTPHIFACDRYNLETELQPEGAYSTSVNITSDQLREITDLLDQPDQLISYLQTVTDQLAELYDEEHTLLTQANELVNQKPFTYGDLLEQLETESQRAAYELIKHQSYICTVVKPSLYIERFKKLYHRVVMEIKM